MRSVTILLPILATACLGAQTHSAPSKPWAEFEPKQVVLIGTLKTAEYFGPPGFGESPTPDSRESVFLIELERPIAVRGDPTDELNSRSITELSRVQLEVSANPDPALLGARVRVTGTLFTAHTGHHHTRAVLRLISVAAEPRLE